MYVYDMLHTKKLVLSTYGVLLVATAGALSGSLRQPAPLCRLPLNLVVFAFMPESTLRNL